MPVHMTGIQVFFAGVGSGIRLGGFIPSLIQKFKLV
jgi:hypothetical protein